MERTIGFKSEKVTAKNAYEEWVMKLGGLRHKGQWPRGKNFANATRHLRNKPLYTSTSTSTFRTRKCTAVVFDEFDKFL
ncbi:hypothetical protein [Vibrio furnissii]|uniref:hypothetical protein n=1 Tax=Vibrio furnissii TaxID=29494 RepID=UPI001EE9F394|nr:hypothetical protein [Vibrio furnissii]MCG6268274.1 hypothetical protein [Vibrio furnissii]